MNDHRPTPAQIDAWADTMLEQATDAMHAANEPITPANLSAFFEREYALPFSIDKAQAWLESRPWYTRTDAIASPADCLDVLTSLLDAEREADNAQR